MYEKLNRHTLKVKTVLPEKVVPKKEILQTYDYAWLKRELSRELSKKQQAESKVSAIQDEIDRISQLLAEADKLGITDKPEPQPEPIKEEVKDEVEGEAKDEVEGEAKDEVEGEAKDEVEGEAKDEVEVGEKETETTDDTDTEGIDVDDSDEDTASSK
jgi:hypothetical protein